MAASATGSKSLSLKEYLKRYESNADGPKKKKKSKPKQRTDMMGVLVVDEEPVWQKPVKVEEEEDKDSGDEAVPQVDEDIEVKRMKRLELIRQQKPYLAISNDGSGWVSVSDSAKGKYLNSEDQDLSPLRKKSPLKVANEISDLSPPRRRRIRADTPSPEPEDKRQLINQTSNQTARTVSPNLSPRQSRKKQLHTPSPKRASLQPDFGVSSPRQQGPHSVSAYESADLSPPRRRKHADSPSPESEFFQQKSAYGENDLSPPRRSRHQICSPQKPVHNSSLKSSADTESSHPSPADLSPPRKAKKVNNGKMGRRAGLLTGQEMKEENDKKREEDALRHSKMASGRGTEPVFRDRQGKKISKEDYYNLQKVEEKPKEKELEWGKGLAQKREAEARFRELELEKEKPFARTRDDPELDKILKERIRFGDPMAHLVKRKTSDAVLEDFGIDEKMKESGFLIPQVIPSHSWIKRGIDPAENRYGIRPGRHWDGVDRSNGYEKELFKRQNEKRATEREAYLWSVSEM